MTGNKFHKDKLFAKISHTATSGVVGLAEYESLGEVKLSVATTFTTSGTLTVQGRIKHSSSWQTIGTLTSGGDFDTFDIDAYDFIRFNFTVAAGSTGEIAASGFFKAAAGGGATNTFATIQTDAGTNPVADSATDTLTLTSSDASITITGNSTTDTIDLVAAGGSGDVTGPASSVDNAVVRFNGTTGKIIQDYTSNAPTVSDTGQISATGGQTNSEIFGASSSVANTNATAVGAGANAGLRSTSIGYLATSTGNESCVVGANNSDAGNTRCTLVGYNANASAANSVAVGYNTNCGTNSAALGALADATGSSSTALGYDADATGSSTVAIGTSSDATNTGSIAIGRATSATGIYGIAIGYNSDTIYNNTLCVGANAAGFASNQVVFYDMTDLWLGKGETNSAASTKPARFHATGGSGTDIAGADMEFNAGKGTGTGVGGHIKFSTAAAGTTGSTPNSLTVQLEITDDGNIIMANLPTSASGLPTGALWNNGGVINIA